MPIGNSNNLGFYSSMYRSSKGQVVYKESSTLLPAKKFLWTLLYTHTHGNAIKASSKFRTFQFNPISPFWRIKDV